jgi:hypothetical protein
MKFKPGDLVKLKGFNRLKINDIPIGIIEANLGLEKYKINWSNDNLARRYALTSVIAETKIELLSES